jgi:hypothetical protein
MQCRQPLNCRRKVDRRCAKPDESQVRVSRLLFSSVLPVADANCCRPIGEAISDEEVVERANSFDAGPRPRRWGRSLEGSSRLKRSPPMRKRRRGKHNKRAHPKSRGEKDHGVKLPGSCLQRGLLRSVPALQQNSCSHNLRCARTAFTHSWRRPTAIARRSAAAPSNSPVATARSLARRPHGEVFRAAHGVHEVRDHRS